MDQIPAAMDRHLEVIQCHPDGGILLGASSLTGRYWYGSLWFYQAPDVAPDVEKCTAGVQLEAGLNDACWVDNTKVLVGMDTGGVALWELTDNFHTFIQQNAASEHDNIVSSVCVCQGQQRAVSASHDGSIKVWDLENLTSLHTYTAHAGPVHCVHNHPSQPEVFLSCSQDGYVCMWDLRKQKPVTRLSTSPLVGIPLCVAWQPGAEHVYGMGSEAGQLVVRDTRAAVTEAVSTVAHHRDVSRIQFSRSQNTLLASVSDDCTVTVIDIADDKPRQVYRNTSHKDFVRGLSWTNDLRLYTCGWDATVNTHKVEPPAAEESDNNQPTKMEVNGDQNETKDCNTKLVEKCSQNGGGDVDIKTAEIAAS